jgi:hypothetical protein
MSEKRPISDSPWFWVLVFSLMALGLVAILTPKYGERQSQLERRYQGAMRAAESKTETANPGENARAGQNGASDLVASRPISMPGNTLITLGPLVALLAVVAAIAWVQLRLRRVTDQAVPRSSDSIANE